ncbi:MAG: OmpA family protein [Candidatus Binataceae bacterium]
MELRNKTAALVCLVFFVLLSGCAMSPGKQDAIMISAGVGGLIGGAMGCGAAGIVNASSTEAFEIGCPTGVALGAIVGGVIGAVTYREPVVTAQSTTVAPPPPLPPPPAPSERVVLRGVHFDFNKANIRADAVPILDEAASLLSRHPNVTIDVNGYCDAIGSFAYNLKLSQRRAVAVANYLEDKGISSTRLITHGYGKTQFVASNATAAGRAENRRVELLRNNQ